VDSTILGKPFKIYSFSPMDSANLTKKTIRSMLIENDVWHFPVLCKNKYIGDLTVAKSPEGKWGESGLSSGLKTFHKVREQWPETKGFHPVLINMWPAIGYYFWIPEVDDYNISPLENSNRIPLENRLRVANHLRNDTLKQKVQEALNSNPEPDYSKLGNITTFRQIIRVTKEEFEKSGFNHGAKK
jgi:hypothetical protein